LSADPDDHLLYALDDGGGGVHAFPKLRPVLATGTGEMGQARQRRYRDTFRFPHCNEGEVDFREQRGVYVLCDDNFKMLYVGQAGYGNQRLYQRLHQHRTDALGERWSKFSWFGIDPVRGRIGHKHLQETEPASAEVGTVLNHLEAILIAAAEPMLNRQGGKFGGALQFYQFYEEAEDIFASRLGKIEERIKALAPRRLTWLLASHDTIPKGRNHSIISRSRRSAFGHFQTSSLTRD
jgi:hypothetical protein